MCHLATFPEKKGKHTNYDYEVRLYCQISYRVKSRVVPLTKITIFWSDTEGAVYLIKADAVEQGGLDEHFG